MCCDETNNNRIGDLLKRIALLQKQDCDNNIPSGCDKPFLGPIRTFECYNTRPITLYSCCDNTLWTMPYTLNGTDGTSSVFRIENLDDNCATFRVLAPNPDTAEAGLFPYVATNDFFTINLRCIGVINCLEDTFVSGV